MPDSAHRCSVSADPRPVPWAVNATRPSIPAVARPAPGFVHTVLIRRATTPTVTARHPDEIYEIEYFLVHAPAGTAITAMITAAGLR